MNNTHNAPSPTRPETLPHSRYALIAQHFHHRRVPLTENGLLKTAYLLQELFNHPSGYRFTLYVSGPESRQASVSFHISVQAKAVSINYSPRDSLILDTLITPGAKTPQLLAKDHEHLAEYARDLLQIIDTTTPLNNRQLALTATLAHLWQQAKPMNETQAQKVMSTASQLKGHKWTEDIKATLRNMRDQGLIHLHT